jgi:hypothetical protein
MIEDIDVKTEYDRLQSFYPISIGEKLISPMHAQIFSGITPRMWKNQNYAAACARHKLVFRTNNIIPDYCFDCYKISIQPRNVIELFKLVLLFKTVTLNDNNTRKCFLRPRNDVTEHYTGLIYFQDLYKAKKSLNFLKTILASEISPEIRIFIKRGCTEFGKAYPEYAEPNQNKELYTKAWKETEDNFDKNNLAGNLKPIQFNSFPRGEITKRDFMVMRTWLSYAKTIGDQSYLRITHSPIPVIPDLVAG